MSMIYEARETAPGRWSEGEWTPAPGVYDGVPNEVYQEGDGTSKSHLDDIAPECGHTPEHYYDKRLAPDREPPKKTDALILGDAIHKAILEPDLFNRNIVMLPEDAPQRPTTAMLKSTKRSDNSQMRVEWWEDWDANNRGKIALKADDYQAVVKIRDKVHGHPIVRQNNLLRGGRAERSYYATDPITGALIKCRVDYDLMERDAWVLDVKSTEDADPEAFARSVYQYRYDVQDAWYRHVIKSASGVTPRRFFFLCIEKVRPFACGIYWVDPLDLPGALQLAHRDHARILECKATGEWPDYAYQPRQLRRINRRIA